MNWQLTREDGRTIGAPKGRVDEGTWEVFSGHLSAAVQDAAENGGKLVIDLTGLEYMSSRGLRALTIAKREAAAANVSIQLAAPNERMREILSISRYDKLFEVVDAV